jgi:hypothetical protein
MRLARGGGTVSAPQPWDTSDYHVKKAARPLILAFRPEGAGGLEARNRASFFRFWTARERKSGSPQTGHELTAELRHVAALSQFA